MEKNPKIDSGDLSSVICANGHQITRGHSFCTVCGSAAQTSTSTTCPNGHDVKPSDKHCGTCGAEVSAIKTQKRVVSGLVPESQTSPAQSASIRTPTVLIQKRRRTKTWLVTGVSAVIVLFVILVAVGANGPQSLSYKDGDHTGGQMAKSDEAYYENGGSFCKECGAPSADISGTTDCQERTAFNENSIIEYFSIPAGDNKSQWVSGCNAGYAAELQNIHHNQYDQNHPGAK